MKRSGIQRRSELTRKAGQLRRTPLQHGDAKPLRASRINPVSARRMRENRQRTKVLAALKADGQCAMCGRGGLSLDGHELLSRARGGSITDPANIVLLCRRDHTFVTENPAWAEANGWALKAGPR